MASGRRSHPSTGEAMQSPRRNGAVMRLNRKGVGNEACLLAFVASECANGGTGTGLPTCVCNFAAKEHSQSRFDECPCAHVLRFFLTPNELRGFWKRLEHFAESFFRERIKLLDANDRCVLDFAFTAIPQKIVIDFAGAKDDALHIVGRT